MPTKDSFWARMYLTNKHIFVLCGFLATLPRTQWDRWAIAEAAKERGVEECSSLHAGAKSRVNRVAAQKSAITLLQ